MSKPALYLHIGHPKAGSTTLQAFLFRNWIYLNDKGFALPTAALQVATVSAPPGNPLDTLQAAQKAHSIDPVRRWITEASKTHSKLILSSECLFEWQWHKLFMEISGLVDIHLVYYVRRQDEIMLSAWRQWALKKGQSLDAFIGERLINEQPDYWSNIAPWRNKVGLASLHVRFTGPAFLHNGSIQHDLAYRLGLDLTRLELVPNQNISIDARLLLFMNTRPEMFTSVHDDSIFDLLQPNVPNAPLRLTLTPAQFERIHKVFEAKNQAFLKKFHPEGHGIAVIDPATAPVSEAGLIDDNAQIAFLKERLAALTDCDDPRILGLKAEYCVG